MKQWQRYAVGVGCFAAAAGLATSLAFNARHHTTMARSTYVGQTIQQVELCEVGNYAATNPNVCQTHIAMLQYTTAGFPFHTLKVVNSDPRDPLMRSYATTKATALGWVSPLQAWEANWLVWFVAWMAIGSFAVAVMRFEHL